MRRVILAILGLLFTTGFCMAQRQPITQRGMATQEMTTEGLSAAHPSIPIGSKARITNTANGKEVEVTITGRISPSATRVVDISPATAAALDIGFGGPVIINQILAARARPAVEPPPPEPEPEIIVEAPPPEPEPVIIVEAPPPPPPEPAPTPPPPRQQPVNITIYNYITPQDPPAPAPVPTPPAPEPKPSSSDLDYLAWLSLLALDSRKEPAPELAPTPPPPLDPQPKWSPPAPEPPAPTPAPAPQPVPYYVPTPYYVPAPQYYPLPFINEVQVIPGFPDPNNGRVYRLQVGSFYSEPGAALAYQQLVSAGFAAAWEYSHNAYRVLVVGIPASSVYSTVYRLGAMGFRQIWVRE